MFHHDASQKNMTRKEANRANNDYKLYFILPNYMSILCTYIRHIYTHIYARLNVNVNIIYSS